MAHQIIYTSVPRGLAPGSKGYCTVVASNGMAPALQRQLESLSQYSHIYPPNTANDALNPTNFQYAKVSFGGKQLCVLSRFSDAGLDYSRRSNLLAHHIALEPDECNVSGPAALIDSLLLPASVKRWEKPPQRLDIPSIPNPSCPTSPMASHNSLGVKPEMVGEIAGRLANSTQQIVTVLYRQDQHSQLLSLVKDVFWLLPPGDRWNTTFSTYYTAHVQNTDCRLRFIPHGTPNGERVSLDPGTIDLNQNMTVLDSEMVRAAREAVKTGNRTLAHPRVAESGHSAGESFTRTPSPVSGPRPPIGSSDLRLQPPPIAQPATQAQSNQDRHKNPETVEVGKFSENQDRHSSGARKKLVIAISIVSLFLLLGIIAVVVLNDMDANPDPSIAKDGGDNAGQLEEDSNTETTDDGAKTKPQSNESGTSDSSGQDMPDSTDESQDGDRSTDDGENSDDASESPEPTGMATEYVIDLKVPLQKNLFVDYQKFTSEEEFDIGVYAKSNSLRFKNIREKRIDLLSKEDELQITKDEEVVNQIIVGLKSEGDQKLLRIKLTDDFDKQLVFSWLPIDADKKADLKKRLFDELTKTVLLVPYSSESKPTDQFSQEVRVCVVVFGSIYDRPIQISEFREEGVPLEDTVLYTLHQLASTSDKGTIKVTANLPKYNAQSGHIQQIHERRMKGGVTEFSYPDFWKARVDSDYKPHISFHLKIVSKSKITFSFSVDEIKSTDPIDDQKTFQVFQYLNKKISNATKDTYLWDPKKHEVKEIKKVTNVQHKMEIEKENEKIKRDAELFHQKFAFDLGKDFLEKRPTSSYEVARANISPTNIDKWIKGAVEYGDDLNLSELEKLKIAKQINERMFEHLPDVEKLESENGDSAFKVIDIPNNKIFTNGRELVFDEDKDLRDYRKTCKNLLDNKYLEPMELEQKTKDLTRWSETLHGLFNIRNNLKTFPIQIQIEVELSFELPENYGMNNTIRMAGKPKRMDDNSKPMADNSKPPDESTDDLVVPILRLGDVPLIKN